MDFKPGNRVSIRPFISGLPNAGLEKYDMVIADGAQHKELLGLIEQNGIKRYLTGLNELAPEVQNISDKEKKEAKIRDIRKTVVFLENTIAGNFNITNDDIDEFAETDEMVDVQDGTENVEDEVTHEKTIRPKMVKKPSGRKVMRATGKLSNQFWGKVTMFISQGPDRYDDKKERIPTYWDNVEAKCSNQPIYLDPKNPHDLIMIYGIAAGGFTTIAPSLEAARTASDVPKFYLDNEEQTAGIKTELKKLRNKAGTELQKMFDRDSDKLFYVTKICSPNSMGYRKNTSLDILYDDCDKYINGETVDKNKKLTAEKFLELSKTPTAELRVQAIVRDATEMQLLTYKQDGQLYFNKNNSPMGKGILDVVAFLKNPLNGDILATITSEVEDEWKK